MKKHIITIGRQFGAGGRELGRRLSERLKIAYYDRELLNKAAAESGLTKEFLEHYDEKNKTGFLNDFFAAPQFMADSTGTCWGDMAAKATQDAILDAANESCIIVGRNADYTLREEDGLLRVFVTADEKKRVAHIMERDKLTEKEAEKKMVRMDRARAASYNFYTNQVWGQAVNYDLCLNLSKITMEQAVETIINILQKENGGF